jgi:acetoin utilization deacetylase AcuC-like enzyme
MFIYHPSINFSLIDYGIEVPMLNQRIEKMVEWIEGNIDKNSLDSKLWLRQSFESIRKNLLSAVHSAGYIDHSFANPKSELTKTFELIDDEGNLNRFTPQIAKYPLEHLHQKILIHMQGSLEAAKYAIKNGFAFYLGGGLHHAMTFGGRGFCHYNDIAVNAQYLIHEEGLKNIWVIDIDAHKGDGTAEIFKDNNKVHTFSIHQKSFWPLDLPQYNEQGDLNPWFIPSDLDIGVGVSESREYNLKLEKGLEKFKEMFPDPDFIFVVSGSDPYEHDALPSSGEINLTLDEIKQRDILVYEFLNKQKCQLLYLISGGYGERAHEPYIEFFKYLKENRL